MSARPLALEFPDEWLDAIVERVVARIGDQLVTEPAAGYTDVDGAAAFLSCPRSRIYSLVSADRIPHHRDGSRLLFDREELREYVSNGGARRP